MLLGARPVKAGDSPAENLITKDLAGETIGHSLRELTK